MAFKDPVLSPKDKQMWNVAETALKDIMKEHGINKLPDRLYNGIIDNALKQTGPGTIREKVEHQFIKALIPSKSQSYSSDQVVRERYASGHLKRRSQ